MPENRESLDLLGLADGYSGSEYYEPSEEDRKLIGQVQTTFELAHEWRLPYEWEWELHRLYLKGEQLLFRHRETGEIVRLSKRDQKRLYSINNHLRPSARSLVGKMTRVVPTYTCRPATNDSDEIYGARVCDAYLEFFRRKEALNVTYTELCEFLTWAGTGCVQMYWDPDGGENLAWCSECGTTDRNLELEGEVCEECAQRKMQAIQEQYITEAQQAVAVGMEPPPPPEPVPDEEMPLFEIINEGDLKTRCVDIRDVFVEPGITDPKKARYIIIREAVPVTEVRARFPDVAQFVHAEQGIHAEKTARLSNSSEIGEETYEYLDDHVQLYEYHEVPTALYPKGRVLFIANNMVLQENTDTFYDKLKRLPFYFFWWMRNPGEFWGESFMAQAWHRQKELNENETQMREYIELLARPKAMAPIGSRIATDEITATTGQFIKYNASAGKVEWLRPPEMPQSAFARGESLKADIRTQAAVTEQEAGLTPTDPNGRAMAIIEAEADQQLGPVNVRNHEEWKSFHRGLIVLAREYYSEDRQFTIAGHDQATETYLFKDMNVMPGWDLELEVDDGLSQNKAVRINQALELMNAGVFMNPATGMPDIDKFSKVARLKVTERGADLRSVDYSAALGLIKTIEAGDPAEPMDEDNPQIFAEVALSWLKQNARKMNMDNPMLVAQIRYMYQFYGMWAQQLAAGMAEMPQLPTGTFNGQGPSQPGQETSAPGGTPSQGMLGAGGVPQGGAMQGEAQQQTSMADQSAEMQARTQPQHES